MNIEGPSAFAFDVLAWVHLRDNTLRDANLLHLRAEVVLHLGANPLNEKSKKRTAVVAHLGRTMVAVDRACPGWGRWAGDLVTYAYRMSHVGASLPGDCLLLVLAWVLQERRGRRHRARAALTVAQATPTTEEAYIKLLLLAGYINDAGVMHKAAPVPSVVR